MVVKQQPSLEERSPAVKAVASWACSFVLGTLGFAALGCTDSAGGARGSAGAPVQGGGGASSLPEGSGGGVGGSQVDPGEEKMAPTPAPMDLLGAASGPEVIWDGLSSKADIPIWVPGVSQLLLIANGTNSFWNGESFEDAKMSGIKALMPDGSYLGARNEDGLGILFVQSKPGSTPADLSEAVPWPNDIVVSQAGTIYSTQRKGSEEKPLDDGAGEGRVHWWTDSEGDHSVGGVPNPNGIALSPDQSLLYVTGSSYDNQSLGGVFVFAIEEDGGLGEAKRLVDFVRPDGMTVDRWGNLYVTAATKGYVGVFSPEGESLGTLEGLGGSLTNCGFGGEGQDVLYVTSMKKVLRIEMNW